MLFYLTDLSLINDLKPMLANKGNTLLLIPVVHSDQKENFYDL